MKPTLDSTTMSTDSEVAVGSAMKPLFHFFWTSMSQFALQLHLRFHSMTKSPPSYRELRRFFASRPCEVPIDEYDAVAYSNNASHRIGSGAQTVLILRPGRTRNKGERSPMRLGIAGNDGDSIFFMWKVVCEEKFACQLVCANNRTCYSQQTETSTNSQPRNSQQTTTSFTEASI